jgi:hypothetical protein
MNVIQIRAKTEEHALKHRTGLFKPLVCIIVHALLVIAALIATITTHVTQIHAKMEELVLPSMIHTCALVHQVIAERTVKSIQMNVIQIRANTEEHALKHRTGLP